MQPGTWLTHRSLIEETGGWNEALTLNDDGEFFARIMLHAEQILFCPGAKVYYRSHEGGSLSGRKDGEAMRSYYESIKLTLKAIDQQMDETSSRSVKADAWRWAAFELFATAPELSRKAEQQSMEFGGSNRSLPGGRIFKVLEPLVGWKTAKRCELFLRRCRSY